MDIPQKIKNNLLLLAILLISISVSAQYNVTILPVNAIVVNKYYEKYPSIDNYGFVYQESSLLLNGKTYKLYLDSRDNLTFLADSTIIKKMKFAQGWAISSENANYSLWFCPFNQYNYSQKKRTKNITSTQFYVKESVSDSLFTAFRYVGHIVMYENVGQTNTKNKDFAIVYDVNKTIHLTIKEENLLDLIPSETKCIIGIAPCDD